SEMFPGGRALQVDTIQARLRLRERSTPQSPRSLVQDLDPEVERVVLRCLNPNPRNRFASALSVAAALPGADPLASALAAGDTPSPEVVAAGRAEGSLRPMQALAFLAFIMAGLAAFPFLNDRTTWIAHTPLEYSPET